MACRRPGVRVPLAPLPSAASDGSATTVGAHEFRNHFGWYMERAAAGEEVLVTHRGTPRVRLTSAVDQRRLDPGPLDGAGRPEPLNPGRLRLRAGPLGA